MYLVITAQVATHSIEPITIVTTADTAPRARITAVWPGGGLLPGYLLGYSRWI